MDLFRAGVWHDLVLDDGESSKFWSIKILKNSHIRKWGALGTMGDEKVTHFETQDEARASAENLYLSKTRKGYKVLKPKLSVTTELVHTIKSVVEINNFIFKVYGVPFNIVDDQFCIGHETLTFVPDGTITNFDVDLIDQWIESMGEYPRLMMHRLLDDCVRQRLIPAGTYQVDV